MDYASIEPAAHFAAYAMAIIVGIMILPGIAYSVSFVGGFAYGLTSSLIKMHLVMRRVRKLRNAQ